MVQRVTTYLIVRKTDADRIPSIRNGFIQFLTGSFIRRMATSIQLARLENERHGVPSIRFEKNKNLIF